MSIELVLSLTTKRLKKMNIELGSDIGEPIAPMFTHGGEKWAGIIKLHLKNPQVDGVQFLPGLRPFILKLDQKYKRGKVAKSFDALAQNNLLSVKIISDMLVGKKWYEMLEEVVEEGFLRGHEYEITNVQMKTEYKFAWIVA